LNNVEDPSHLGPVVLYVPVVAANRGGCVHLCLEQYMRRL
jgi:hypothetical protein